MTKKLRNMSDEELAEYREGLANDKRAIADKQIAAEEEFQVREALRGVSENVKTIILSGRVEASGDASN